MSAFFPVIKWQESLLEDLTTYIKRLRRDKLEVALIPLADEVVVLGGGGAGSG